MPSPRLPIRPPSQTQPQNSVSKTKTDIKTTATAKANNELGFKGILCIMIGLGVLISPHFITSPGMQTIVAQSAAVGWFALALGAALLGLFVRRRIKPEVL